MAVVFFISASLTFISFWVDVGKIVVEELRERALLVYFGL